MISYSVKTGRCKYESVIKVLEAHETPVSDEVIYDWHAFANILEKKVLFGVDNWGTSFNTVPAISVTICRKEKGYLQGNYFTIISSFVVVITGSSETIYTRYGKSS